MFRTASRRKSRFGCVRGESDRDTRLTGGPPAGLQHQLPPVVALGTMVLSSIRGHDPIEICTRVRCVGRPTTYPARDHPSARTSHTWVGLAVVARITANTISQFDGCSAGLPPTVTAQAWPLITTGVSLHSTSGSETRSGLRRLAGRHRSNRPTVSHRHMPPP